MVGFLQRAGHRVDEFRRRKLVSGHVHGHPQRWQAVLLPQPVLPAGLAQHPFADRTDQAGVLGQRDEVRRRDQAALRMLPADQGLDAGDQAAAQVHLRLVEQHQFGPLQGLAQVGFHVQAPPHGDTHVGLPEMVPPAASRLGLIQGRFGVPNQPVQTAVVGRVQRNADAGAEHQFLVSDMQRQADAAQNLVGYGDGRVRALDFERQAELVTANPAEQIIRTQLAPDAVGQLHQHLVGHVVAEALVQDFETVQVERDHGELGAGVDTLQPLTQPFPEAGPIRQPGQHVVIGKTVGVPLRCPGLQQPCDAPSQHPEIDRLGDVVGGAGPKRSLHRNLIGQAGDHQHRRAVRLRQGKHLPTGRETVLTRQAGIQQHQVRAHARVQLHGFLAVAGLDHAVAF